MKKLLIFALSVAATSCFGAISGDQAGFELQSKFFDGLSNAYFSELASAAKYENEAKAFLAKYIRLHKAANDENYHAEQLQKIADRYKANEFKFEKTAQTKISTEEQDAINGYENLSSIATQLGDQESAAVFEQILKDEKAHAAQEQL